MPTCIACQHVVDGIRMEVIKSMKDTALNVCSVQCYEAVEREAPELIADNTLLHAGALYDGSGKKIGYMVDSITPKKVGI